MDFEPIIQFATQQGIWCALFVWLFYTSRKESKDREDKLISCLNEQGDNLQTISNTLDKINDRLVDVEKKLDI